MVENHAHFIDSCSAETADGLKYAADCASLVKHKSIVLRWYSKEQMVNFILSIISITSKSRAPVVLVGSFYMDVIDDNEQSYTPKNSLSHLTLFSCLWSDERVTFDVLVGLSKI